MRGDDCRSTHLALPALDFVGALPGLPFLACVNTAKSRNATVCRRGFCFSRRSPVAIFLRVLEYFPWRAYPSDSRREAGSRDGPFCSCICVDLLAICVTANNTPAPAPVTLPPRLFRLLVPPCNAVSAVRRREGLGVRAVRGPRGSPRLLSPQVGHGRPLP